MAQQTIRIKCPSLTCQKILAVPVSSRGKTVRCVGCGGTIRVPAKSPVQDAEAPEAGTQELKKAG